MKLELLTNKIAHFSKIISEKQAIIKYLEEKSEQNSRISLKSNMVGESFMNYEELHTYRSKDRSFAKEKNVPLTFESVTNGSAKLKSKESNFVGESVIRDKRIKTQSTDIKENYFRQNFKTASNANKLKEMLCSAHLSNQNEKTLAKNKSSVSNSSFWKHGSMRLG